MGGSFVFLQLMVFSLSFSLIYYFCLFCVVFWQKIVSMRMEVCSTLTTIRVHLSQLKLYLILIDDRYGSGRLQR